MRAAILFTLLSAAVLCCAAQDSNESWQVPVLLGKDGWMVCENPRFGFSLPVPPAMKAERPPDNGSGQSFISADGKLRLTGWAHFNTDGAASVEAAWNSELAAPSRSIIYKRKTEGWFVVSGVKKDGTGFYTKYFADARYFAAFTISYPQADEKKYQPSIERIAKDFQPRLGKGEDRIGDDEPKPEQKK